MRKITSFIMYGAVLFLYATTSSCKKELVNNPGNNATAGKYYMRFKDDGIAVAYTNPIAAFDSLTINGIGKIYIYDIIAGDGYSSHSFQMAISDTTYLTGNTTYKESDVFYGNNTRVNFVYMLGPYYPYLGFWAPLSADFLPIPQCEVTITELTATTVKGTFFGFVFKENDQGDLVVNDNKAITEGEFYLPLNIN